MIHYQLIGAVRDPYISKYEVEIRRERLEAIKEEMILSCSEIKHHSYKTTNGFVSCDNRITNFHTSKIRTSEENNGLEEYLVEYDEIIYPYEVKLIEKVLKEDNTALEELLDIISNPKRVSKETKYQNKLLETKEKRNAICDLVREGKLELSYGVLVLNQLDETINSLEDHIERNKDRRPVFDFYQSLRESFIFHNVDMLLIRDFDRTLSFFDYTDDKSVFDKKINRIKRKVLKTDK